MNLTIMKADCRSLMLGLLLVSGCTVFNGELSSRQQQDSAEEVRLKAVLLEAEDLAGSAIDITIDGVRYCWKALWKQPPSDSEPKT